MDPSFQALGRFFSDEDIERARRMIPQEERVVMFFVASGIDIKPAVLVKEFGMNYKKAVRLIEKIRQEKFSGQKVSKMRPKSGQNPSSPKRP